MRGHEETVRIGILNELEQAADHIVMNRPSIPVVDQPNWCAVQMREVVKRYPNLDPLLMAYYLGVLVGAKTELAGDGVAHVAF